ncbi:hypothetical protein MPS_0816 [Mycobacterium pseudoshottsii JCM 15466]|nr:hypothetical protein MPS_0816 [Mycobacterium pseudoshottsii JCM 15466]
MVTTNGCDHGRVLARRAPRSGAGQTVPRIAAGLGAAGRRSAARS